MKELKDWLTLIRTPGLGARRLHPLIQRFGTPAAIIQATGELRSFGIPVPSINALQHPDERRLEADLGWLEQPGHHLLTISSDDYPPQLRELPDPPVALFVVGDPATLWLPQLAIVGSRNATSGGLENARTFAGLLAGQGLLITSGLALGVDAAAHQAALTTGGRTIAVAATGLDRVYPARHKDLAAKIVENGAIISEFPPGVEPRPGHFPTRNRIISGLSVGTLVVEASVGSGSLITARQAVEQGRDVFAVPGSIHNPLARGCHQLIKQGAKLVESAEDLYEELIPRVQIQAKRFKLELEPQNGIKTVTNVVEATDIGPNNENNKQIDNDYQQLMEAVGYDPTTIDQLVERTDFAADAVSSMLLILELDGKVHTDPGGGYYRSGPGEPARSAARAE